MFGFDPPTVIKTEVFTSIPENCRPKPRSKGQRGSASTLEGPSFDREGSLYFTDVHAGRIFRATTGGDCSLIFEYEGAPNGLKIHKDGRIFVVDHRHGVMIFDPVAGSIKPILEGPGPERFKGLNDLVFASNGDLYFTDQGATGLHDPTGRVFCLTSGGQLRSIIDTVPSPNGIVLNKSESTIFVAVTRANAVWIVPMTAKGVVSKAGLFAQLPSAGPDGLAADEKGNIAVAHPGLGIVWVFDRRGLPIYRVESCTGSAVTNIAYGGPENRWLYITESESSTVIRAEMPAPGRLMFSHQ